MSYGQPRTMSLAYALLMLLALVSCQGEIDKLNAEEITGQQSTSMTHEPYLNPHDLKLFQDALPTIKLGIEYHLKNKTELTRTVKEENNNKYSRFRQSFSKRQSGFNRKRSRDQSEKGVSGHYDLEQSENVKFSNENKNKHRRGTHRRYLETAGRLTSWRRNTSPKPNTGQRRPGHGSARNKNDTSGVVPQSGSKEQKYSYSGDLIRLVKDGSDSYNTGHVQVYIDGVWGYICNTDWDLTDASVACRQLGFPGGAVSYWSSDGWIDPLGPRRSNFLMGQVGCTGSETRLADCRYQEVYSCSMAARVHCRVQPGCGTNWFSGNGKCYKFYKRERTIAMAAYRCGQEQANLVSIATPQEHNFLSSFLQNLALDMHLWHTGGRRGETNWYWVKRDGDSRLRPWSNRQMEAFSGSQINNTRWFPGWPLLGNLMAEPSSLPENNCLALSDLFQDPVDGLTELDSFYWKAVQCNNRQGISYICAKQNDVSNEECYTRQGATYRGTASYTEKGFRCLDWSSSRSINERTHPDGGLGGHNFCRNPDFDVRPWCWVDHAERKVDYCRLSQCTSLPTTSRVHATSSPARPQQTNLTRPLTSGITATISTQSTSVTPHETEVSKTTLIVAAGNEPDCYIGVGQSYRGTVSVTENGSECLRWSLSPSAGSASYYSSGLGDHNYCRNPDNDLKPWCWLRYGYRKWSYCRVSRCSQQNSTNMGSYTSAAVRRETTMATTHGVVESKTPTRKTITSSVTPIVSSTEARTTTVKPGKTQTPELETVANTALDQTADTSSVRAAETSLNQMTEPGTDTVSTTMQNYTVNLFSTVTSETTSAITSETTPAITSEKRPAEASETTSAISSETMPAITSETTPAEASETTSAVSSETMPAITSETTSAEASKSASAITSETTLIPASEEVTVTGSEDCYIGLGLNYRGNASVTEGGRHCLKWSLSNSTNERRYPNRGLGDHNFCRNPDFDFRPWCWVDHTERKFGYCRLPDCNQLNATTVATITPSSTKLTVSRIPVTTTTRRALAQSTSTKSYLSRLGETTSKVNVNSGNRSLSTEMATTDVQSSVCPGLFHCVSDNKCIPLWFRCDDDDDCLLGEDEVNCDVQSVCPGEFHCDREDECLPLHYRCDKNEDCLLGEDEDNCVYAVDSFTRIPMTTLSFSSIGSRSFQTLTSVSEEMCAKRCLESTQPPCGAFVYFGMSSTCHLFTPSTAASGRLISSSYSTYYHMKKKEPQCNNTVPVPCDGQKNCLKLCDDIQIRLVGDGDQSGTIVVRYDGQDGVICDDEWDTEDATVICRMLGYNGTAVATTLNNFSHPIQDVNIFLDNVECLGDEASLIDCKRSPWAQHDCSAIEIAGVRCQVSSNIEPPLRDPGMMCGQRPYNNEQPWNPPVQNPPTLRPNQALLDLLQLIQSRNKIVGGGQVSQGAYPWQARLGVVVSLFFGGTEKIDHACGAGILSEFWLVTAAHCFREKRLSEFRIVVGDHDLLRTEISEQTFLVGEIIKHERHNDITKENDIALIKIQPDEDGRGIKFNNYVQPLCLPDPRGSLPVGTMCLISGWGNTVASESHIEGRQQFMPTLRAARVPIVSSKDCDQFYRMQTIFSLGRFYPMTMLCAGFRDGGVDTCDGDSGGPLVCELEGVYTMVGVTAWGRGCGLPKLPGVYTRISAYVDWIYDKIRLNSQDGHEGRLPTQPGAQ